MRVTRLISGETMKLRRADIAVDVAGLMHGCDGFGHFRENAQPFAIKLRTATDQ